MTSANLMKHFEGRLLFETMNYSRREQEHAFKTVNRVNCDSKPEQIVCLWGFPAEIMFLCVQMKIKPTAPFIFSPLGLRLLLIAVGHQFLSLCFP